jgi:hypothetical protein
MTVLSAAAYASSIITCTGDVPDVDDVTVLGSVTYVWKAAPTTVANQVKIGADIAASVQNLYDAINRTGTAGTQYGSGTVANPDVVATAVGEDTVTVKSRVPGTVGNFIPTTTDATELAWTSTVLAGGTGSVWANFAELQASSQLNAEVAQLLLSRDADPSSN